MADQNPLATATPEDLERWARALDSVEFDATRHIDDVEPSLVALASLARAVAKMQREGTCRVEQSLGQLDYLLVDVPVRGITPYGYHALPAALAALLEAE